MCDPDYQYRVAFEESINIAMREAYINERDGRLNQLFF